MWVFSCVSAKTGSMCRTTVLVGVRVIGVLLASTIGTTAVSSSAVSGVDGVALTRKVTLAVVRAPVVLSMKIRMVQSALPVGPHAPQDAQNLTVIVPAIVSGP